MHFAHIRVHPWCRAEDRRMRNVLMRSYFAQIKFFMSPIRNDVAFCLMGHQYKYEYVLPLCINILQLAKPPRPSYKRAVNACYSGTLHSSHHADITQHIYLMFGGAARLYGMRSNVFFFAPPTASPVCAPLRLGANSYLIYLFYVSPTIWGFKWVQTKLV